MARWQKLREEESVSLEAAIYTQPFLPLKFA
jgi:hypothetical protein